MHAVCNRNMHSRDDTVQEKVRPLRAPAELPRPALRKIEILHRPPQTSWIKDDSLRANTLLDGLASYLRTRDPT